MPTLVQRLGQRGQYRRGRGEQHPVAVLDRLEPERHGEVRPVNPVWAEQHQVLAVLDEVAQAQLPDRFRLTEGL